MKDGIVKKKARHRIKTTIDNAEVDAVICCLQLVVNERNLRHVCIRFKMSSAHYSGLFLLFWLSYLFLTGLNLFGRGFLLNRIVISTNSTCQQTFDGVDTLTTESAKVLGIDSVNSCWLPPRFNKSIVIVIDGFRYDFAKFNAEVQNSAETLPFENKLTVIHRHVMNNSENSALLKFMADPPTTTLQRLKGLITGSLPTFIDAGRNFASFEIEEDNIIDQLVTNRKKIVFLGDDTWTSLLPNRFYKSFPFPSFDVKDLHTVDDGIQEHLVPTIRSTDWDVIIAHFLGVDHCGHRFGPHHEMMGLKLSEMNRMLESVIKSMDNETILFVMGDHGMTNSGDHGGDSEDELTAALFMHSKDKKLYSEIIPNEISQVDFPPTFSLLLGLPIPFGNLGKVVNEMFIADSSNRVGDAYFGALASYLNFKQVERYLNKYITISSDISVSDERFKKLQTWKEELEYLLKQISNLSLTNLEFSLQRMTVLSTLYVRTVLEMCHQVWAQFDYLTLLGGIFLTSFASLITFCQIVFRRELQKKVTCAMFILSVCGFLINCHSVFPQISTFLSHIYILEIAVCLVSILIYVYGCKHSPTPVKQVGISLRVNNLSIIIFPSILLLRFSNSYVVTEDSIVCFFLFTLISYEVLRYRPQEKKKSFEGLKKKWKFEVLSHKRIIVLVTLSLMCCLLRLTKLFWKCREEQWWCESSQFLQPASSIPTELVNYRNWRLFISVVCMMAIIFSLQWILRKAGNLNGFSLSVVCYLYSPFIIGILTCLYWILQTFPPVVANNILPHQHVLLPNVAFIVALISTLVYFYKPLFIYNVVESQPYEIGPIVKKDQTDIVHQVYRHLKANWKKHLLSTTASVTGDTAKDGGTKKPLIVYGLATIFSAPVIATTTTVTLVMILLSRDGLAPAFFLLLISAACCLHIIANVHDKNEVIGVENSWILLWSLLASVGFYATGHQPAFPSVQWESGLVGTDGNFSNNILPAIKVVLNTFSSTVIFGLCLPLLMLWPITNRVLCEKQHLVSDAEFEIKQGEFLFYGNRRFYNGLFDLCAKYLWLQEMKLLSSMLAVALHRRHLMVWKIFAPKFLFESFDFIMSVLAVHVGYLLMLRVYTTVDNWLKVIENQRNSK